MLEGLGGGRRPWIASIGIDSWAVDYGLLDADGALLGNPVHYRDSRTDGVPDRVAALISRRPALRDHRHPELPFNTLYQLVAARGTPQLDGRPELLLIPDLLAYWLTGERGAEVTNASTTELLDVRTGDWSQPLIDAARAPAGALPAAAPARRRRSGRCCAEVAAETGLPAGAGDAVGSHDTASAVVGVPAADEPRSPTSPAAPGRWSAWSWTGRC